MPEPDPLVVFLRKRISEDVAAARAAYRPGGDGPWTVDVSPSGRATVWQRRPEREAASTLPPDVHLAPVVGTAQIDNGREVCEHVARHGPARVLAEAVVKTAILDLHEPTRYYAADPRQGGADGYAQMCSEDVSNDREYGADGEWPCQTVLLLAQPYRQGPDGQPHPDWRDEWTIR
jgi:hypothetical protein